MISGEVDFSVLGPVSLIAVDGTTIPLGGTRQRCFLALLLLDANRVLSVEALIEGVWGEQPPNTAQTMLHQFASRLRPLVEPTATLVTRKPGYALELPPDAIDANRFAAAVEAGKALIGAGKPEEGVGVLDEALGLWKGRALEDLRFEPALTTYADDLEQQRIAALEERFDVEIELGRHVAAIGSLRQLVTEHPERARLVGQLMLALYRAGRQAEALSVYDTHRRYLAVELGLSPGPQVEELHGQILADDPSLAAPAARRRPDARRDAWSATRVAAALAALVLVSALVSLVLVYATEGGKAKSLVPEEELLPFPPVPSELLGSYSAAIPPGQSEQLMTLRAADDPVCKPLLGGKGTCFLIHPVTNELDPGARGQAAYHEGMVVLRYVRIPFIPACQREIDRYRITAGEQRLVLDKRVIVMGPFDECSFAAFTRTRED